MISMARTLSVIMLGACEGLTLTRDENIALVKTRDVAAPARLEARNYPLHLATGIDVSQNIELAFTTGGEATDWIVGVTGDIILTCLCADDAGCCQTDSDADGVKDAGDDVRTFPMAVGDPQVSMGIHLPVGVGGATYMGFVTLNPMHDLNVGKYEVSMAAGVIYGADSDNTADMIPATETYKTVAESGNAGELWAFTTQASCESLTTKAACATDNGDATIDADERPDCMWTGSSCENHAITVSGVTAAGAHAGGTCDGTTGQEVEADGVPNLCGVTLCTNGVYTARGLYNGKPVYSQDWNIPMAHGGSRIQWETAASADVTKTRGDSAAGWTAKCGGAPRFTAATGTETRPLSLTWTLVANYGNGPIAVAEASCVAPTGDAAKGYSITVPLTGVLTRGAWAPTGISCASGYSGTAKATVCEENETAFTLSGCSKNSRRRRKHHKHKHWNNSDAAAPFNPFWWFR